MRYYSAIAPQMILQGNISGANTTFTVDTVAGLPGTYPFTLVIDAGVSGEEIVNVTNVSSLTITCTRGVDGSTATSHTTGAIVRHMMTARDLQEPQTHMNNTAAVHGVTGNVVGHTDTQTLSNKTISGASNTITNVSGANITGANNVAKSVLPTDVDYINTVQTLTNKTLTSPVINTPTGIVKGDVGLGNVDNTSDATKNAAAVVLTNKTINAATNSVSNIGNSQIIAGVDAAKISSVASSFVAKTALPTDVQYNLDSGNVTGTSACTAVANWQDVGSVVRYRNGVAIFSVNMKYTAAPNIVAGADGNIADTTMCQLTPTIIPFTDVYGAGAYNARHCDVRLDTSGNIIVYHAAASVDITTNTVIRGTLVWNY